MDGSEVKYRTYFVSCAWFFTDLDTGFHKQLLNVCHNVAKKILTSTNQLVKMQILRVERGVSCVFWMCNFAPFKSALLIT